LNYLNPGLTRKQCAFVSKIDFPLETLTKLIAFFSERRIPVESLQMQGLTEAEAVLVIHCLIERDRIRHVWYGLEKIKGILELELLESRGASIISL
jgi:hypothetical protein